MAAATAAALARRRTTGRGCHIDAAMYEICVQQMYDAIAAAAEGARPSRTGNDDARTFSQGVYPTNSNDRWIAITLRTEAEWHSLCELAPLDPQVTGAEREERLSAWTRHHCDTQLAEMLQARGIAAGTVQDIEDLVDRDPQLAHRRALIPLDHPRLGPFGHVRAPFSFSRSEIAPFRAPRLGEHSHDIAQQLCALTPERIAELEALGVFR
jgi:crotonobetainyl-CoA:carnitine CoA-transferase CaiB-like acyl-CoA transferase